MTTIKISDTVTIIVEQDPCPDSPANWDNVGRIAYCSRHHVLGTENVSKERLDEIRDGIESGDLVGLPVYAYVHGAAMIKAAESNPFHCPWDSGQSGFVYCTKQEAIKEFGKKILTQSVKAATLRCLRGEVDTFSQYLEGDVWGYRVLVDGEEVEACWGIYGHDEALAEARSVVNLSQVPA